DLPQKALDGCLNSCTEPICADPSKVKFGTNLNPDLVTVHGRLVTDASLDIANEHFVVQLTDGNDISVVIFRTSLLAGHLTQVGESNFKYKNKAAKTAGGMYTLKVVAKPGYYKFTLKAYGDVTGAQPDMRTQVFVGAEEWRVRGIWQQLKKGWLLTQKPASLQP